MGFDVSSIVQTSMNSLANSLGVGDWAAELAIIACNVLPVSVHNTQTYI